jgi:hypothetical protein
MDKRGYAREFAEGPSAVAFALKYCSSRCDELILLSTKPFWFPDATVLKPLSGNGYRNEALERRTEGDQTIKTGECDV